MAGERTLPGLGLTGFWAAGSNGWGVQNDANLRKLSALVQAAVLSATTPIPAAPANGDMYLVPADATANANQLAVRDNGAWVYFAASEGLLVYVKDANEFVVFDGAAWGPLTAGFEDAPSDGTVYGRKDAAWVAVPTGGGEGGGIADAPADGTLYGRKDAAWVEVPAGEGGGTVSNVASIYTYFENGISGVSTSAYAMKGTIVSATQDSVIGAMTVQIKPDAAGEQYQLVIAKLGAGSVVTELALVGDAWVSTSNDELNILRVLSEPLSVSAGEVLALVAIRTDGGTTTVNHVIFPGAVPDFPMLGFKFGGSVREAALVPSVGSTITNYSTANYVPVGLVLLANGMPGWNGGGGGGGLADAPEDGVGYVRKDGEWVPETVAPAPYFGAHAYWRLRRIMSPDSSYVAIALLDFGVPATGGTALSSSNYTGQPASNAFDASLDSWWISAQGSVENAWVGYHFPSAVEVDAVTLSTGAHSARYDYVPLLFSIEYSDDGVAWVEAWASSTDPWEPNQSRTFEPPAPDTGIEEAPEDGTPYVRQDATWVAAPTGGGGGGGEIIGTDVLYNYFMLGNGSTGSTGAATKGNLFTPAEDITVQAIRGYLPDSSSVAHTYRAVIAKLGTSGLVVSEVTSSVDQEVLTRPAIVEFEFSGNPILTAGSRYFIGVTRTTGVANEALNLETSDGEHNYPGAFGIGLWIASSGLVIGETFSQYTSTRHRLDIVAVVDSGFVVVDAPEDGTPYVRQDGAWVAAPEGGGGVGGGIEEAPADGVGYVRKNSSWVPETVGEGGGGAAPFQGALVVPTAVQNYPASVTVIRFAQETYDIGGFWTDTAPNKFTVPAGVTKVRVSAGVRVNSGDPMTAQNQFWFYKNGVSAFDGNSAMTLGVDGYSNNGHTFSSGVISVQAGDVFELVAQSAATFALDPGRTWFAIEAVETINTAATVESLLDTDVAARQDGDTMVWDATQAKWVAGLPVVAANVAQGVNKPFRGAMAAFTADKSLSAPTSPVIWDTTDYDTDALWSAASPGRFTIPAGVTKVRLSAALSPEGSVLAGSNLIQFLKNGASFRGGSGMSAATGWSDGAFQADTPVIPVVAGDFFEVRWNTSDSGTNLFGVRSYFSIEIVEAEEVL